MLQIEVLAFLGVLATIDLMILLGICFAHKKESLERIKALKDNWFDALPLKFADLGDNIRMGNLTPQATRKNLNKIIKDYDIIEEINKAYTGKKVGDNILKLLGFNLLLIVVSALFALASSYSTDYNVTQALIGLSLAVIIYFFIFLAQVIYFIIKEEDKFQKIEKSYGGR